MPIRRPTPNPETLKAVQEMSARRKEEERRMYENMTPKQKDYIRRLCDAE